VTQYSFWQKYPDAQIEALDTLLDGLFKDFRSLTEIVGHDDIAPTRKTDPGPAFDEFMTRLKQKHDRY
jgi:N-acetylmuramoyl-L-alanine amidase